MGRFTKGFLKLNWRGIFSWKIIRRALISLTAVTLSIWFSYVRDFVGINSINFFKALVKPLGWSDTSVSYELHIPTVAFVVGALIAVGFLMNHFGKEESEARRKETKKLAEENEKQNLLLSDLNSLILNLPDSKALSYYPERYMKLRDALNGINDLKSLEEAIIGSFKSIDDLARMFVPKVSKDKSFQSCVNFMPYLPISKTGKELIQKCRNVRIHYLGEDKIQDFEAYLYLDKRLCYSSEGYEPKEISLPLFKKSSKYKNDIPGATKAYEEGTYYTGSLDDLLDICSQLDSETSKEVRQYFGEGKDGENIETLFSFKLEEEDEIIGVLNIHSDIKQFLGGEIYLRSFIALLTPLTYNLYRYLKRYQKLLISLEE